MSHVTSILLENFVRFIMDSLDNPIFVCTLGAIWGLINSLSTNPTKWSNIIKQFVVADELFECV